MLTSNYNITAASFVAWTKLLYVEPGWVTLSWAGIPPQYVTKPTRSTQLCIAGVCWVEDNTVWSHIACEYPQQWKQIVANCCTPFTYFYSLTENNIRTTVRLTARVITGVSFGSGTTDCTTILSDDSILNCSVIRWVKSASFMMPT